MKFLLLIPYYVVWHYTLAISNIILILNNFIWFAYDFFSVEIFLKKFFHPIGYVKIIKIKKSNNLLRIFFGFFVKTFVLIIALFVISIMFFIGTIFFLTWLILPILIPFILISGLIALFN
ncbi:MAG TPA: hypothetical protein PJ997_02150 [Candidatus Paceibacterota bacterium]|nr:hypothetical protein [Candidatus Paceibacterota bacterium]HMP19117.1 hypothetical protein [Candidatus Paceibacterota bacterium]